ncbi:MAG: J domain-containing protein [Sphingobacteriales bacterium]|nr:MAG: J domain-containing protein [Sphingobacteriales bacterium]
MSTRDEIRRQYRKLAKQYHPDATNNDLYASAKFHDIKEAYETLTQPVKKEEWLKERWLRQVYNTGNGETVPLTPFSILEKVLKYERVVAGMDVFRMDHFGVVTTVQKLLSAENLDCLSRFQEPDMNRTIIRHVLMTLKPLPYRLTQPVIDTLKQLAGTDAEAMGYITDFQKSHQKKQRAEQWTMPLVILATVLICAMIFLASRH